MTTACSRPKSWPPTSGRVWENVGLLGSPPFEIPRSVERQRSRSTQKREVPPRPRRQEQAQLHHHLVVPVRAVVLRLPPHSDHGDRRGFLRHIGCSDDRVATRALRCARHRLLDPGRTDRDRVQAPARAALLDLRARDVAARTVLESALDPTSRCRHPVHQHDPAGVGIRIGRRVFNDGCAMPERSLVIIGDDCTLNESSTIQCHSQEDGIFKSDYSILGSNVTSGTGSHVHYGVTIGDGAELTTDCFLMKGEQVLAGGRWGRKPGP